MKACRQLTQGPRQALSPGSSRAPLPLGAAPHGHASPKGRRSALVSVFVNNKTPAPAAEPGLYATMTKVNLMNKLASSSQALSEQNVLDPKRFTNEFGERVGFICSKDVQQDAVILSIPEDMAVTSLDAEKLEHVGAIASSGCGELVALTLWLIEERAKGAASAHAALIATLPERTNSPLLWPDSELEGLLRGSGVVPETRSRVAELKRQWQALQDEWFSKNPQVFKPELYSYDAFAAAFCVVLAHALYLPSAQMFALLPLASSLGRTGNGNGCNVDYDEATQRVVVTAARPYREGQEVLLNDERPNGELLMVTGALPESNMSDYVEFSATLIQSDKYYIMKRQILDSMGFTEKERFPVYADRMPLQLLAYVRLARVQDPALFAKVSFEQDVLLNQMNEYEVLQLLMGDCRERLAEYQLSLEEDIKMSQRRDLGVNEKLAAKLRLTEKRIISATMDAVRQRLAPIRGIPTKSGGMQDPNSDLREIFDSIEGLPTAPIKILDGFLSWAKGEQDPDWNAPRNKKAPPRRPW